MRADRRRVSDWKLVVILAYSYYVLNMNLAYEVRRRAADRSQSTAGEKEAALQGLGLGQIGSEKAFINGVLSFTRKCCLPLQCSYLLL